ncbi:MAG: glycosyltransferase family 39 protein [bacterium]|nr:glycosyltransferase family 39 protein [bacterium]
MKTKQIDDFWLYKFRYQITYTILFASYLAIIFYSIFIAPNGLTNAEVESATFSANLDFSQIFSAQILNFPFRILQKISIGIFGLSNFSIKLPAILISFATIFAIIRLAHIWFERGTATMASIIAITSSQFFFIAQNGTPDILYIFYPILLILAGGLFMESRKITPLIVGFFVLALSFYTPLTIYIVLAMLLTILAHPRLRLMITREIKKARIFGTFALFLLLAPLAVAIFFEPAMLKTIFGIPDSLNLFENFNLLISNLFSFSSSNSGGVIAPIINPAAAILIAIGLYFTFSAKYTAKSYLVNIWSLILLAVCVINPNLTTILFTPILLLTITGLQSLIQTWYMLFPKNPYARVFGLFPIVFFVVSLLLTSLNHFQQSYVHSPEVAQNFSQDLRLLLENSDSNRVLMVSKEERDFYAILENQNAAKLASNFENEQIIVSKKFFENLKLPKEYRISRIITSSASKNSDRFYILHKI